MMILRYLLILYFSLVYPVWAAEKVYDYMIQDAYILDGESYRGFEADVAISGREIARIGEIDAGDAEVVIDGSDLVLAPGLIDVHTHSDFNAFVYEKLPNKLLQGVTSEVTGNCGMSASPVLNAHQTHIHGVWAREGVRLPELLPWTTHAEYSEAVELEGSTTNLIPLIGHGNLRTAVMGLDARAATPDELEQMKGMLEQSMEQGAYGISFGLVYLPGTFADDTEVLELCRVAGRYEGVCAFHMRSEGSRLLESLAEVIRIGEETQARIQISHLKAAGEKNWHKMSRALELIEEARNKGITVQADAYPYAASFAELGVILPDELYERPDRDEYFQNPENREEIVTQLNTYYEERKRNWDKIVIAATEHPDYRNFNGISIAAAARQSSLSPVKWLVSALADTSFRISAFNFSQNEDRVAEALEKPFVMLGSDSIADGSAFPHPRAYGAFSKVLQERARDGDGSLAAMIRRMTSVPAEHFGLKNRGRIKAGYAADLILFAPEAIVAQASYQDPKQTSQGMAWVFVNGQPVVRNGQFENQAAGYALSKA